jgi:hypothetical protein
MLAGNETVESTSIRQGHVTDGAPGMSLCGGSVFHWTEERSRPRSSPPHGLGGPDVTDEHRCFPCALARDSERWEPSVHGLKRVPSRKLRRLACVTRVAEAGDVATQCERRGHEPASALRTPQV